MKNLRGIKRDMAQLKRREPNVLNFILYGLLFDTVVNLWKPFSVKFLERLGGGTLEISLLNALPGLVAALVLIPGAMGLSRFGRTKKTTAAFILVSRALLLVAAFIPALPAPVRPMLFVILVAVINCPDALSQTALQSYLGDIFTGTMRARAITLRNKFGNAAVPVVTLATGMAITFIPSTDAQRMLLYQLFFVGAFLVGVAEVFVFSRFKDNPDAAAPKRPAIAINRSVLREILTDKRFALFLWPILTFVFFWQAGWPLCSIYQVENLKANEWWFALFSLMTGLGAFFSAGFWQRFIRKRGNMAALILSAFSLCFNLILFPLSPNVWVLALVSPFGGIATMGFTSTLLNGALETAPDDKRLVYLAFFNTATNITLFVAPMLAHVLNASLGLYQAFFVIFAGRVLSAGFILLMRRVKQ